MKKAMFILMVFCVSVSVSSCKKCYICSGDGVPDTKYCSGSVQYEQIKQGTNPTDIQGQELSCK